MKFSAVIVCLILLSFSAQGIVIRHDREESAYREMAANFPMVIEVGGGMGTLIAPDWVLTAGHVAESIAEGQELQVGAQTVTVAERFLHPSYGSSDSHRDLGLLRLSAKLTGVEPAALYEREDEAGQRVTFVGSGYFGNGLEGPSPGERIFRAAHNTVESVRPGWIRFRFDAPPAGDDLEGISGPGDSGGPALIETEDGWAVAGVSAYNDGSPECTYGSGEHYSRVSDELDWILGVLDGSLGGDDGPRLMKYGTNESGQRTVQSEPVVTVQLDASADSQCWTAIEALVSSFDDDEPSRYLSLFNQAYVAKREAGKDPLEGMFEFMVGVVDARGPVAAFHPLAHEALEIAESKFPMRPVVFHLEDGTPGYVGLALDEHGKIDHMSLFVQKSICAGGSSCELAKSLEHVRGGS